MRSSGSIQIVIIITLGLVLSVTPALSLSTDNQTSTYENPSINLFFDKVYNFYFTEADSIVEVLQNSKIDRLTLTNLKANLAWWRILSGDNIHNNLKNCNDNLKETIKAASEEHLLNSTSLLNTIYAYSLKSRLESHRGNRINSLIYFYKSIDYIDECIKRPMIDDRARLLQGLYYYLSDYVWKEYQIVGTIFLPASKGTREMGLKYLEECSVSADRMIRTEANYFLLKIYTDIESEYKKASYYADILTLDHPNNLVYSLEKLKLMILMNRTSDALVFHDKLVKEIPKANFINSSQKTHFLDNIEKITKTHALIEE